jgi:hypothetical protein
VNKDFDPAELSWISGDVPDDPSLTVNSFDLQYYTKASAAVTADDPNWIANPGTTVTGVTSPHAMAFAYDTVYFWRIHSNVTWTTTGSETIPSQDATVVVEPSQVPPKVDIEPDGARTWPGEPISLPTTVKELDAFSYEWTVVGAAGTNWPAANPPGDPNLFLTGTTLVDQGGGVWTATPVFTPTGTDPNILGQYEIKLVATDGVPSDGSDTMWVTVHETPCETFDASDGYIWPFDDNFDCEINLEDYAAWAAVWLEDRNPTGAIIYFP